MPDTKSAAYLTISAPARAELTIKKSRFIAQLAPADSVEAAKELVAAAKKEFYDARHNPFAYVVGADKAAQKSSDDGEPGGTAGMPILSVLNKNDLTNIACVVTRYFGGIKLGASGLARAYGDAAALAVAAAGIIAVGDYSRLKIAVSYSLYQGLENYLRKNEIRLKDVQYAENVTAICLVAPPDAAQFRAAVTDLLNGRVEITEDGQEKIAIPIK